MRSDVREMLRALPFSLSAVSEADTWTSLPRYESAPARPFPPSEASSKRLPAFCPAVPDISRCDPDALRDSCQSSASFFESSITVTAISTSFCGTSSFLMILSYISMREVTSRTKTALSLFSGRITGRNDAFSASS